MKTIIAGSRENGIEITSEQMMFLASIDITVIVTGGSVGTDRAAETYGRIMECPISILPAKLSTAKTAEEAVENRNRMMCKYADACVLFPGGPEVDLMFDAATNAGIVIHDRRSI